MIVQRDDFPKGPAGEVPAARRERFVLWLKTTHDEATAAYRDTGINLNITDPQLKAAQHPIKTNCIEAKCWTCVHGDDPQADPERQGWPLVTHCRTTRCELHSVRPNQPKGAKVPRLKRSDVSLEGLHPQDHAAKALANPGNRKLAIRGFCFSCCGGHPGATTMREVAACTVVVCPLWPIRPGAEVVEATESNP
jgi:hypothetical protein